MKTTLFNLLNSAGVVCANGYDIGSWQLLPPGAYRAAYSDDVNLEPVYRLFVDDETEWVFADEELEFIDGENVRAVDLEGDLITLQLYVRIPMRVEDLIKG